MKITHLFMGDQIKHNIYAHNSISGVYNSGHVEIYNSIEQQRIESTIADLISLLKVDRTIEVLDFGAGTGNLSLKFLEQNCKVTACDVSDKSLKILQSKSNFNNKLTVKILDSGTLPFDSNSFDIVATYSVLHHVPDYLNSVKEMVRICKPGGFVYIDHEKNNDFWNPCPELKEWLELTKVNYLSHLIKLFKNNELFTRSFIKTLLVKAFINKRYEREGDIHIWKDDHIDWNEIFRIADANNCLVEKNVDYLLFSKKVSEETYNIYKSVTSDMKFVFFKKMS